MAIQLAFPVPELTGTTLAEHVQTLGAVCGAELGAPAHAEAAAAITERYFADWADRSLSGAERRRVEAYLRGVLRRRVISMSDADARSARSRLVARSIEEDLIGAGWDPVRAARQARTAAGIALSA